MKEIYKCEKCKVEFDNKTECAEHEFICTDYQATVQANILNAIKSLKEKYNFRINMQEIGCYIAKPFSYIVNDINIEFILPNGNRFKSYREQFDNCDLMNYDEVYKLIESFITPLLKIKYEGIICNNPDYEDYYDPFFIGENSLREIASNFFGKKVRIEIINESNDRQEAEEIIDKYLEEIDTCDCPSCTCDHGNI